MSIQRWNADDAHVYSAPTVGEYVLYSDHVAAVEAASRHALSADYEEAKALLADRDEVYRTAIDDCIIEAKKLHFHYEGMATCRECGDPDDPCPTIAALEAMKEKP